MLIILALVGAISYAAFLVFHRIFKFNLLPSLALSAFSVFVMIAGGVQITGRSVRYPGPKSIEAQLNDIKYALDQYALICGSHPTAEQGLQALVRQPTLPPSCDKWGEPY